MKKSLILLTLIIIAFGSCSKDDKLIRDAEKFLKSQLKNPKSYERITLTKDITVTFLMKERIDVENKIIDSKDKIAGFEKEISGYEEFFDQFSEELKPQVIQRIADRKKTIDSLNVIIAQDRQDSIIIYNKLEDNRIYCIYFHANYRATNSFGGLIPEESTIVYYPQTNKYEIY